MLLCVSDGRTYLRQTQSVISGQILGPLATECHSGNRCYGDTPANKRRLPAEPSGVDNDIGKFEVEHQLGNELFATLVFSQSGMVNHHPAGRAQKHLLSPYNHPRLIGGIRVVRSMQQLCIDVDNLCGQRQIAIMNSQIWARIGQRVPRLDIGFPPAWT